MPVPSRVLFAGGGTGGHVFPAVAVAQAIRAREPDARILFALPSGKRGFLERSDWDTVRIPAPRPSPTPWRLALSAVAGFGMAAGVLRVLLGFRPTVVVGTGGYGSACLVMAARLFRIPVVLLEPNAVAGRANRFLSRWAAEVHAAWEFDYEPWGDRRHPFSSHTRLCVTGNPVRSEILERGAGPGPDGNGLLVFGGSLGAAALNRAACEAVPALLKAFPGLRVRHVTGSRDERAVSGAYAAAGARVDVHAFMSDMPAAYREAGVVVCRAGGNTLAEVLALGKAAILVPFPGAQDGHQRANAVQAAQRGAAVMVEEQELTPARLAAEASRLLGDAEARRVLAERARALARPDAARVVAERVLAISRGGGARAA